MPLNPTLEEQRQALARRAETNFWVRRSFWLGTAIGSSGLALVLAVVAIIMVIFR